MKKILHPTIQLILMVICLVFIISGCSGSSGSSSGSEDNADVSDTEETDDSANSGTLVINEIVAKDANGGNDWIELYVTEGTVALGDYTMVDDDPDHEPQILPDVSLSAGNFYTIEAIDEEDDCPDGSSCVSFKLGSDDSVTLFKNDVQVDTLDWAEGEAGEGYSFGLLPDGTGTAETLSPTKGAANEAPADSDNTDDTDDTDDSDTDNSEDDYNMEDYVWNASEVIGIVLNGDSIAANTDGATVDGSIVTITSAGTYSISGTLYDGKIMVDTEDEEVVRLIFNGVDITSSTNAPVYIVNAERTAIILAEGTENYLTDAETYIYEDAEDDEPNAALHSKDYLTIGGDGSLTVTGNYNDGITGKDGFIINSGTISVTSVDDGIRGKDYLIVKNGNITVTANGDGLKSDNDEDTEKGYISVENGAINITTEGDAIQAETYVLIADGDFALTSGGGSNNSVDEDVSQKGIKAGVGVIIDGGNFTIDSADDAVHSNDGIIINNGIFDISTGDDGMHADATLEIYGGDIRITKSYEGIESAVITIGDGNFYIVSSDDGINVAGGADGSSIDGRPGGPGQPGQGDFSSSSNYYLYINGGYIAVYAVGDGIDVNGSIEMTDGVVIIHGPTSDANSALDYDGSFVITGGFFVGAGSSGMAQAPGSSSTQYWALLNFSERSAGTLFHIQTNGGVELLTFSPSMRYESIVFSSPALETGTTYDVYFGGSSTGTETHGLYEGGTYAPGTKYTDFTVPMSVDTGPNR